MNLTIQFSFNRLGGFKINQNKQAAKRQKEEIMAQQENQGNQGGQKKPSGPKMINCPQCKEKTPETGKFCLECGKPLKVECGGCKATVANTQHCSACGANLQAPAAKPKKHKLEVTPVGSEGQYQMRVQATADGCGVKSRISIVAKFVYGLNDPPHGVVPAMAFVLDGSKTSRRNQNKLLADLGLSGRLARLSVFETDDDGFLECVAQFDTPLLEIAFGLIGTNADIAESVLKGPAKPVVSTGGFHEAFKAVTDFNRQTKTRR